jgi:hypothetical protein
MQHSSAVVINAISAAVRKASYRKPLDLSKMLLQKIPKIDLWSHYQAKRLPLEWYCCLIEELA